MSYFSTTMPNQRSPLGDQISAGVFAADVRFHAWMISRNSVKVSNFVRKYGEKSANLITQALAGAAQECDSMKHAADLVNAVGRESAALLPPFINAYYYHNNVDHRA